MLYMQREKRLFIVFIVRFARTAEHRMVSFLGVKVYKVDEGLERADLVKGTTKMYSEWEIYSYMWIHFAPSRLECVHGDHLATNGCTIIANTELFIRYAIRFWGGMIS